MNNDIEGYHCSVGNSGDKSDVSAASGRMAESCCLSNCCRQDVQDLNNGQARQSDGNTVQSARSAQNILPSLTIEGADGTCANTAGKGTDRDGGRTGERHGSAGGALRAGDRELDGAPGTFRSRGEPASGGSHGDCDGSAGSGPLEAGGSGGSAEGGKAGGSGGSSGPGRQGVLHEIAHGHSS